MSTLLFIDGLPSEFTNAQLNVLLEPFGAVATSTVAHRRNTQYLSFGLVWMKTLASTNAARAALHGTVLSGTALRVDDSISPAFGWLKKPEHTDPDSVCPPVLNRIENDGTVIAGARPILEAHLQVALGSCPNRSNF